MVKRAEPSCCTRFERALAEDLIRESDGYGNFHLMPTEAGCSDPSILYCHFCGQSPESSSAGGSGRGRAGMALDAAMWEIRLRIGVTDREANVLPVRDGRPHIESEACRCRPSVETLDNGGRVVLHNSRDGREFFEREVAGNA